MESWRSIAGHSWTMFGATLVGIIIGIVDLISLIVASIPATMLVYLTSRLYPRDYCARRVAAQASFTSRQA